jgi:hypothetical protein
MSVYRNTEARLRDRSCRGGTINITYCTRLFADLVMQHAELLRRIILPSVAVLYFCALSHKRHKTCFVFLYNFYLKHFTFCEEFREVLS